MIRFLITSAATAPEKLSVAAQPQRSRTAASVFATEGGQK